MNQKREVMFEKSPDYDSANKSSENNNKSNLSQRDIAKQILKEKYNITDEKAELVLLQLENKTKESITSESSNQSSEEKIDNLHNETDDVADPEVKTQSKKIYDDVVADSEVEDSDDNSSKDDSKHDVDSLLSDIVHDYGQEVSIELEHVDLTFELIDDKIDTIKESFIRAIKHNKSRKSKFKVLDDISFKIFKGEKVGIIGYNGAGKSTLLKVITGIYPPDSGKVITNGNISPLLSLGAGFDRNYSGRKNIYLNGAVLGHDKQFLKEREEDIIEFSELGRFIDYPIKNYSSGMLAKLGFSIATMLDPDILIIDEILGVGDVTFRRKSSDKIQSLMDGKTTVLLVSHSIPQIRSLCDKAIWIDNGKVRETGDVNEVCDHYLKDSEKASKEQLENIRFR